MAEQSVTPPLQQAEEESVHRGILDSRGRRPSPWIYIPTLYYAESIPYIMAMTVSVIMYKKFGISNTDIALYTSLLYLPWVIKPLWSPLVDIIKTKRWWVVLMQGVLGVAFAAVALAIPLPNFFAITLAVFWIMAFSSSTHDIACDGFYMLGLSKHQQAFHVGIRSTFYRFGMLTGQGLLVIVAGWIESRTGLEAIQLKVNAVTAPSARVEMVRYVQPSDAEKALIDVKDPVQKLEALSTLAAKSETFDQAATYASLADQTLKKFENENPASPDLPKARDLAAAAEEPLNKRLAQEIAAKEAGIKPDTAALRIVIDNPEPQIPIGTIPKADSDLNLFVAQKWNALQGQPVEGQKKEIKVVTEPGIFKKALGVLGKGTGYIGEGWERVVAKPLGNFLRTHFGEEKKELSPIAGNLTLVSLHLSQPPPPGKDITVTFGRKSGDKSVELKEGARFVFSDKNWNKPVHALLQLDHRLKAPTDATYSAAAGNIPLSWIVVFALMAVLFAAFCIYHYFILPHPVSDTSRYMEAKLKGTPFRFGDFLKEFFDTFVTFFHRKGILAMLAFLCFYRFSEAQLVKLSSPFLLDRRELGGLALTTEQVGIAYGTVGLIGLMVGGLLGGWVASVHGLKKWIWWMVMAINIPHFAYVYMSYTQPENIYLISALVGCETFGYGFAFTAYTLYMIYIAEGPHKTAHFAITTGFMALGMMIPGMFSGWIQSIIGYKHFFIWIVLAGIPGILTVLIIPLDPEFGKKKKKQAAA